MNIQSIKVIILSSVEECDILIHDLQAGYIAAKETKDKLGVQIRQQIIDLVVEIKEDIKNMAE